MSIGAPRILKIFFFVTQFSRIAVDLIRADGSGDIQLGSLSTKLNQTHFQGPAPRPLPGPGAVEECPHALESHPFRPAGQAKRRAHLGRGSQLCGGSSSGQPRGEQSPGRVQNVCRSRPGANPSDGVRNYGAGRLAGSSPTKHGSSSLRSRARPWCAPVRPPAPRTGPAWSL